MYWSVFACVFVIFMRCLVQSVHQTVRAWMMKSVDGLSPPHMEMSAIPDVVLEDICNRLLLMDALALRCTCRSIQLTVGPTCDRRVRMQFDTVIRHFPAHVIKSVPMAVWLTVEWIDFNSAWLGSTGYLDNVDVNDLRGVPYKCCYDDFHRLALLIRRNRDIAVLFQRYTDDMETWVFASKTLPIGGCRLSASMVARLALWMSHDYAKFSPY